MMAYGKMCVICKRYTLVKIHTCRECLKNRINGLENRKYCNRCKTVKITSDFNKQSSRNDGLGDYCRECKREKDNKYNRETGNQRFGGSQLNIIQRSAKTRGYECYFTKEKLKEWWFSTIDTCYYCGIEIDEYNKLRDYISNYEGANRYILKFKASQHRLNRAIFPHFRQFMKIKSNWYYYMNFDDNLDLITFINKINYMEPDDYSIFINYTKTVFLHERD